MSWLGKILSYSVCVSVEQIPTTVMTATSEATASEAVGLPAVPRAPDHKKWTGRRKPAPYSKCDVRTATTAKIGQTAEEKKITLEKN